MPITVTVTMMESRFVATLTDGRDFAKPSLGELAHLLARLGVPAADVQFHWGAGERMITAGQKVALLAEINRLGQQKKTLPVAA